MADRPHALTEMRRVLNCGGTLAVLEFSVPESPRLRALYLTYFRHILPAIGRIVSGDIQAYRYLNTSVEEFPPREQFSAMLRNTGFSQVSARLLTFGVAMLYLARK